jgi:hypothetical protein
VPPENLSSILSGQPEGLSSFLSVPSEGVPLLSVEPPIEVQSGMFGTEDFNTNPYKLTYTPKSFRQRQ